MIKKILRNHTVSVLTVLAIVFLTAIIALYAWGIGYLVLAVNEASGRVTAPAQVPQFDLDGAAKLDYRGTLQASP